MAERRGRCRGRPRKNQRYEPYQPQERAAVPEDLPPPHPVDEENLNTQVLQQLLVFLQQNNQQNQQNVGPVVETHDRILERFLRLDPPIFHGEPDDMRAEQWLDKMESILTVLHYNEEQKLMLVVFRLEVAARDWWRVVDERWNRMGTERTWENFVQEFRKQYIPRVVRETRRDEFHRLRLGLMIVTQYEAEFHRLSKYAPGSVQEEEDRLYKFTRGLRPEIQRQLLAIRMNTYDEAVEAAAQVESGLSRLEPQPRGNFNPPSKSFR
ncbi:hypothetical protein DH2020_021380 [Rehmannia glutinosa]|uniref:Retrotransposon gag domain-containing protein n=1 Tax=Rehmannia glutinosa TaxID=99300 RepID=A0ABR0WBR1_REHGL